MEPVRNDEERREVAKEGDARGGEAREPRRRGEKERETSGKPEETVGNVDASEPGL